MGNSMGLWKEIPCLKLCLSFFAEPSHQCGEFLNFDIRRFKSKVKSMPNSLFLHYLLKNLEIINSSFSLLFDQSLQFRVFTKGYTSIFVANRMNQNLM